jgi:DNA repair exonuclease SbcCD ATPase subunit
MTRGKLIRAVGGNAGKDAAPETGSESSPVADHSFDETMAEPMLDDEIVTPDDANGGDEYLQEPARWAWIAPTFAVMAVLGWTGFFGWAMQAQLLAPASIAPTEWVRLIIDWAIPVALIGVVWMIAMRNSRAEASRFAASAALLSQESQQLETRLTVVNRELSLAREFLASQSRELETLGRMASERISTHAGELQQLIHENGVQVDRIGSASETALSNMTLLRDDLPVVANSARDVNNQIANAGRSARENLDRLIVGFERLNEFGKASETQFAALGSNIGEMLGEYQAQLDQLDTLATERLVSLKQDAENYRLAIDANETVALSAMRDRISALQDDAAAMAQKLKQAEQEASAGISEAIMALQNRLQDMIATIESLDRKAAASSQDRISKLHAEAGRFDAALAQRDAKFLEEMERRQAEFETRETQASELLSQRLSQLDEALAERREAQLAETAKLVEYSRAMSEELGSFNSLIAQIGESSESARTSLSEGISSLESQLNLKRNALAETQEQLMQVTDASVRLLEIIQSGARQSREDLPQAISTAADALSSIEERSTALNTMMLGTKTHGEELGQYLIRTKAEIEAADSSIDALQAKLSEQAEDTMAKLQGLRGRMGQLSDEAGSFAGDAQEQLREALERLEQATQRSFAALDTGAREKVRALAEDLSDEALKALERGLRNETAETIGALEQAASHAAGVGREATVQLRDQLAMVNELTGNLEQRITRAREVAEEQVNNDFARRMALLTDSLNSSAIDITGALSTEVTDTAWEAYLKGDRGIFTRRAVRLIDNGEAREIAELYQSDDAFKANVSRYIHDFEAMLRSILSTRDGKALSVTLLGSDMGKLYVLLAQSIERFRN